MSPTNQAKSWRDAAEVNNSVAEARKRRLAELRGQWTEFKERPRALVLSGT